MLLKEKIAFLMGAIQLPAEPSSFLKRTTWSEGMGTGLHVQGGNENALLSQWPANPNHTRSDSVGLSFLLTWACKLQSLGILVVWHTALPGY